MVKSRLSVREAAVELMRALHNKTRQTVNLSVRQGDEIVYIDRAFSERSGMQVVRAIGGRGPLPATRKKARGPALPARGQPEPPNRAQACPAASSASASRSR